VADSVIDVDYLIVGAGAVGMAFADSIVTETEATIAIVDRNHRPGGHWNDAYPFVRLHQPSSYYGVNSRPLGTGAKDAVGLNAGYPELASGQEVLSHFDLVMQQQFLPSGRVHYFPMSEASDDGTVTSLLSGARRTANARKVVDATHSQMKVPSRNAPQYAVAADVACVPLNDLPRAAGNYKSYVVVGAGKTGMDACIWLLQNGAEPDTIRWIMPRDSWLVGRANFQVGAEFFARTSQNLADEVEALAEADTVDDVFARLEACDSLRRLDPEVKPEAYHCAVVSEGEVAELRRIRNVVRLGRVTRIEVDQIVLEHGTIPTDRDCLHVDCSAAGIPGNTPKPVFDGDRITLQWVRLCQPTFSAALIGHVEATYDDEAEKNHLCTPISPPTVPRDWLRMMQIELRNRLAWSAYPKLTDWQAGSRLDPFTSQLRSLIATDAEAMAHLQRYLEYVGPATKNIEQLLLNGVSAAR